MSDIPIIIYDSVPFFASKIAEQGFKISPTFRSVNFWEKLIRKISLKIKVGVPFWYDEWKQHAHSANLIIVFANRYNDHIRYLAKKFPGKRIVVWYWNPVFRCFRPNTLPYENIEYWSFDVEDCKTFDLQYNTTFYFHNIVFDRILPPYLDIVFLGKDKGRKGNLLQLKELFEDKGFKTNFHIVPDLSHDSTGGPKPMSYEKYLKILSASRAILDFVQEGQGGLTLRPMESIFLRRKLITNDLTILKQDFYNSSNIFVLGVDDINNLKDFLISPYVDIEPRVVLKYEFKSWLQRFSIDE